MLESIESRLEQLSAQMDANYDVQDRTAAPFSQIAAKELRAIQSARCG